MAELRIVKRYQCGCGFSTPGEVEAIAHSQKTGHTLTILGEIRNNSKRSPIVKRK